MPHPATSTHTDFLHEGWARATLWRAPAPMNDRDIVAEIADYTGRAAREALLQLSAALAAVDGTPNRQEYLAFRTFCAPDYDEVDQWLRRRFALAATAYGMGNSDPTPWLEVLNGEIEQRTALLECFFRIAAADGSVNDKEANWLKHVTLALELPRRLWLARCRLYGAAVEGKNPYALLGLSPLSPEPVIRQTYRTLLREYHPDALRARGIGGDRLNQAEIRARAITEAYHTIARTRGFRNVA